MFSIVFDFLTGMAVGAEWKGFDEDDEDGLAWALVFHLVILRITFLKYQDDSDGAFQG